jgi:tetratricopeptide (TPR) repeat protein
LKACRTCRAVGLLVLLALACAGDDLEGRLGEIRERQDQGRAAETLDELAALRARHGENAEISYRLGLAMIAAGRPTEAVFPLHDAAESDEYAVQAGLLLASTLASTNNYAEALRAADRVLARDAEHEAALLMRATAATQLHDGAVALETAERLVAKAPENQNYRFVHAAALAEAERLDDADAAYRELLAVDWTDDPQGAVRACATYARFLIEKRKDVDRAVEEMKGCVEKHPEDISMVAALGNLMGEFERDEDLLVTLQGAVERHPDSRPLHDALIGQLAKLDRLPEARALAEKWADEAKDAKSWAVVASVRRELGDVEGALDALDRGRAAGGAQEQEGFDFFRAELLLELGRLDEADQAAQQVRDELSRTILDARLAQARGDLQRALDLYGKVSIQWPQNHAVRALAARAAYQLGDTERAKSDLLEATRQAAKETDAALWLAQIYFAEANFPQALAFAQRHIRERGTPDPRAHLLVVDTLVALNQPDQAFEVLSEMAKLRDGQFTDAAWAARARLRARKAPAEALAELEREIAAAKLDLAAPEHQALLDTMVDLRLRAGEAGPARKRVAALLAARPDSAHLHALDGRLALASGDAAAAAAAFERALALDPSDAMALSGRAFLAQSRGDLAAALDEMKKAEAAAPDVAEYAYMVARLTLDQGDRAAGRAALERVLIQHPASAAAANDLAFLLAEDAVDLPLAQRHAERAVRLQPSAETLDTLGFVRLRQGAAEEAVGMFERALARKPEYATARYHLALALIEKGEPMAARAALEQALEGPFPEQQEARKVLAKIDGGEARP